MTQQPMKLDFFLLDQCTTHIWQVLNVCLIKCPKRNTREVYIL